MTARSNTISVTLGRKGSGKSHYVRRRWCDHEPRLVTLDYTGEGPEHDPSALVVYDVGQAADTFAKLLRSRVTQFHVVAQMQEADVSELYGVLVPTDQRRRGVARSFGGMAVTCDELSLVAPLHGTPDTVRNALMIGRHHALSQHYATQRPQNVSGMVKGQADVIASFRMHEVHERKWIADTIGAAAAHVVPDLPQYTFVEYDTSTGVLSVIDRDDKVLFRAEVSQMTRDFERAGRMYRIPALDRRTA